MIKSTKTPFKMKGSPIHTGVMSKFMSNVEKIGKDVEGFKSKITKTHKLVQSKNILATLKIIDPNINKNLDFKTKANLNVDYKVSDKMKFSLGANVQNYSWSPVTDPGSPSNQPFYAGLNIKL